jgi:hypothetical protein
VRVFASTVAQVIPVVRADGVNVRRDEANVSVVRANDAANASSVMTWEAGMRAVTSTVVAGAVSVRTEFLPVRTVL